MPPSTKPLVLSKTDPRAYIKSLPLPIPTQKGLRIQARSNVVYNPTEPNRDIIRKQNYDRRRVQMRNQGFRSRTDKPYQTLGEPLYLDTKQLILHSLGQWEEGQHLDSPTSSASEDEGENELEDDILRKGATSKFGLRRNSNTYKTLNKELTHQRLLMRNVKLGYGLFQQLRRERDERMTECKKLQYAQRIQELQQCQPARYDESVQDMSDDDTGLVNHGQVAQTSFTSVEMPPEIGVQGDTEGTAEMVSYSGVNVAEATLDQTRNKVAFDTIHDDKAESVDSSDDKRGSLVSYCPSMRSNVSRSISRKKLPPARPYTPQHTFLGAHALDNPDILSWNKKSALFRQLCCLFWLLEAMHIEAPMAMGPICKCWDLNDIGGGKSTILRQQIDKKSETKWKLFTHQVFKSPALNRRLNTWRQGGGGQRLRINNASNSHDGNSVVSMTSLADGLYQAPVVGRAVRKFVETISHECEHFEENQEEEELLCKGPGALQSLDNSSEQDLSTVADQHSLSLRSDDPFFHTPTTPDLIRRQATLQAMVNQKEKNRMAGQGGVNAPFVKKREEPPELPTTQDEILKFLENIAQSEDDPRFHALANPKEKMTKDLRADINVLPKLTPAVMEYIASLPSNRVGRLAKVQRQLFSEVKKDNSFRMHDLLEEKDKTRLRVLKHKFLNMPMGASLHDALKNMRKMSNLEETNRNLRRNSSNPFQMWYTELVSNISTAIKIEWYFQVILNKLSKHGMMVAIKDPAFKLLKVLSSLRDWEICCPDITAAIEYCRERICDMTIDEYEDWFRTQFPTVLRPQTAPPANRNGKDKKFCPSENSAKPKLPPRSAPPGLRWKRLLQTK